MGDVNEVGYPNERPAHNVTLSDFYMGKYEVTQAQYQAVMGNNPTSFYSSKDFVFGELQFKCPVENVSWFDAIEFCNKLSEKEGLSPYYLIEIDYDTFITCNESANGYRLPTEAQWEYAARGGNGSPGNYTFSGSDNLADVAWCYYNNKNKTHEVGKKPPNNLGLYDMTGNVWEWCWDLYGDYSSAPQFNPTGADNGYNRVLRGGGWNDNEETSRSTYRKDAPPYFKYYDLGFRLVRPVDSSTANLTFIIGFDADGGTPAPDSPVTMKYGSTINRPPAMIKTGYIFDNWYMDSAKTIPVTFPIIVTGNVIIYAKWISYLVITEMEEKNMIFVPGGTFQMGDVKKEGFYNERPIHTVTLSGFYIGKYTVTQEQYQAVMKNNPSVFLSDPAPGEAQLKRPVESLNWYDVIVFCNKLSIAEGLNPAYSISGNTNPDVWGTVPTYNGDNIWDAVVIVSGSNGYRLPTEAQWEYAAKGGDGSPENYTYSGSNNPDSVAWYNNYNYFLGTHEVGMKSPNGLGLYDMSGNVWEWCWDWLGDYSSETQIDPMGASSGTLRVLRGGGWGSGVEFVRSANRHEYSPGNRNEYLGFRLVRPW